MYHYIMNEKIISFFTFMKINDMIFICNFKCNEEGAAMSLGYGGMAHKSAEDNHTVIYNYGGFNLGDPQYRNENNICDGIIWISKSCFPVPEIHERIRKMPSGRKKLVKKRILLSIYELPIMEYLSREQIIIENSKNCWKTIFPQQIDYIAIRLLDNIFREYQATEKILEHAYYMV